MTSPPTNNSSTRITPATGLPRLTPLQSDLPKINGYELIARIGAGAMGEVYQGRQLATDKEVALKVIGKTLLDNKDFTKRFEREIELLSKLDHPNIAPAIGHGVYEGRPYLAMEYIRGPDLASLLKSQGPFHEPEVLRIGLQIARALQYAHETAGLIHRDIKPANLLVVPNQTGNANGDMVKIIDFGLARSTATEDHSLTITGMVMGTPYYMSPEQIRGEKDIGIGTDIYALGATMYHLLTGNLPYDGASPVIVMSGHLHGTIPDPGKIVPSLNHATRYLVMTAMAKDANKRFLNYRGFITCCETALEKLSLRDGGTVRLLRKPMTKTKPRVRTPGEVIDPFEHELPARLRRKESKSGESDTTLTPHPATVGATFGDDALIAAGASRISLSGTDALHRVQTDKIRRIQTTTRIRRYQNSKASRESSATHPAIYESAAFHAPATRLSLAVPVSILMLQVIGLGGFLFFLR
jgi:serine/threonine protein kinase